MRFFSLFFVSLCALSPLLAFKSIDTLPYAGLVLDKLKMHGIEITDFAFENGEKAVTLPPEEEVSCTFKYEINAEEIPTFHRHHLVFGLYKEGAQECALSSFGIKDYAGESVVTLRAPKKPGVYQVRVAMVEGFTCEAAKKKWEEKSSSKTVLGLLIVK